MKGHNFESGNYCIVTELSNRPLWDFIIYTLIPHFPSIDHTLSTFDTDLSKMTQSEMLQISKKSRRYNYKAHLPVICPIDHCTTVPCPFKFVRVIQPC